MKVRKLFLQCLVVLIFCHSLFAQQPKTVQLSGRILDIHGSVIPGIVVVAHSQARNEYESYADQNGIYVLNLPKGIYSLKVNKQAVKYNAFEFVKFNNYQVVETQDGKLNFDIALPVAGDGILCILDISDRTEKSKLSKKKSKKNYKRKN